MDSFQPSALQAKMFGEMLTSTKVTQLSYQQLALVVGNAFWRPENGRRSHTHVVWPNAEQIDRKFLWYHVNDERFWIRSGSAQPFVVVRKTFERDILLPPLDEQQQIVAEIEKQFTRLDVGVSALRRVQVNLKRYRAAVLKDACEGKLVPTEAELSDSQRSTKNSQPAYESGEQLLKRILAERCQKWAGRGKYKEPAASNTAGLPPLPKGWTWASLDQLLQRITDGDHLPPPQRESGVPFLVIGNVRTGKLDFKDSRFVGREYYEAIESYRKPQMGDVLYTLVGSYGIALRVDKDREFCIQRHIGIMRPHALSPSLYLVHVLNSPFVFQQATVAATGTAQKTVPLAGLRRFTIPLPPLAEQTRIVAEVERRLSVVEELQSLALVNLQRATRLRQSILQRAFRSNS